MARVQAKTKQKSGSTDSERTKRIRKSRQATRKRYTAEIHMVAAGQLLAHSLINMSTPSDERSPRVVNVSAAHAGSV